MRNDMDIRVNYLNTSYVQIEAESSIIYELRDFFSFQPPGYQYQKKFKYGGWNGFIYMLDYNGRLPYGLYYLVQKFADNRNYTVEIDPRIEQKEDINKTEFDKWISGKDLYSGSNKIEPYWYQSDSVFHALKNRRCVLNLPTSAGKSLIQALISRWYLENYNGKVLIIVPTTSLVNQMINDFVDYRIFPKHAMLGIMSGTKKDSDSRIYVSTWQSAIKQPKEWFSQFGCLMVDECHKSTGKSITEIINSLDNCIFKIGLSGSLKEGKANMMQYVGAFGGIFKPVNTRQLIDEGQVSNVKIKALFLRYPELITRKARGFTYQEEIKLICSYKARNRVVAKLALGLAKRKENVFLMFNYKEHGKEFVRILKEELGYDNVVLINGDTDTDERDQLRIDAESSNGLIVVGSIGVLSTGVSIKKIHHIIFGHPCKSAIIVKQSIGRVLRKHDSKDVALVWDIIDDIGVKPKTKSKNKYVHVNYGLKHAMERIRIYNEEHFDYSIIEKNLEGINGI